MIAALLTKLRQRLGQYPNEPESSDLSALAEELHRVAALIEAIARLPEPYRQSEPPSEAAPVETRPPVREPAARDGHRMVRRLRGGYLPDVHVTVPESAVRNLDAHDGDVLEAVPVDGGLLGPGSLCHFRLLDRGQPMSARERREVSLAVLDDDDGRLAAVRQAGTGSLAEALYIPNDDVIRLGLKPGDVVDLAYWADAPAEVRVAWHYRDIDAPVPAPAPPPVRTRKRRRAEAPAEPTAARPGVAGRSALVVGCEPKRQQFADALARHGINMEWVSGNEGQSRLAAAVQRADAVVVMTKMVSHQTSQDVPEFAKAAGVPYRLCTTNGIKTVTETVLDLLETA